MLASALCVGIALGAEEEGGAQNNPALSTAPQEPAGVELSGERTATSQTFLLPDGSRETRVFDAPINYEDESGNWRPIEEGLKPQADGSGLINGANAFELSLPERIGAAPVRLDLGQQWISAKLLGPDSRPVQLQDETASYETADPGTSFQFTTLANGLKEDIELAGPAEPRVFHFELEASSGLSPVLDEGGAIEFRDQGGEVLAVLPAPVMYDRTEGQPQSSSDVHYQLGEAEDGGWELTVDAESAWLNRADLQWPVTLDPTVTVPNPSLDCGIGGMKGQTGWGGCGSSGQKELAVSYLPNVNSSLDEWARALLRFPLTSIPSDAYIASATLGAKAKEAALNTTGVELRRLTTAWDSNATWTRARSIGKGNYALWSTEGGDYSEEVGKVLTAQRGSQAGWWAFPVSAKLVEELAPKGSHGESKGPLEVLAKLTDEQNRECGPSTCTQRSVKFESSAAAVENRPYLSVNYYLPAPAASKVTSPSEGQKTARWLKLQAAVASGTTGVTFQYREAISGIKQVQSEYKMIPSNLLHDAQGKEVGWPLAVSGAQTPPVYFDALHATQALRSHGGAIEIRALFDGSVEAAGYSAAAKATVDRFIGGPRDASTSVGPGTVNLLTGNLSIARSDVSIPAIGSALEFSRSHNSRDAGTGIEGAGVLGPGWKPGVEVEEAGGAEWRSIREVTTSAEEKEEGFGDYALLTDLEGYEYAFEKAGESYVTPPEFSGWLLSREDASHLALSDPDGNRTVFENSSGGSEYLPVAISMTGGATNSAHMVYQLNGGTRRLSMIVGASAPGIECPPSTATEKVGCRSLTFSYLNASTWGGDSHLGDRLAAITFHGASGPSSMTHVEVAKYAYNSEGRLTEEWDPRISPALKEKYSYATGGQIQTLTPPGQEPWSFEYGSYDEEQANGRLVAVKRASLLASPSVAQTTIVYGVPLSGSGAPYDMGQSSVSQWGQQDLPSDATAIFPPSEVPSSPPSSYTRATVYYMDAGGQLVNTASPSGAGTSAASITTTEYDEYGNAVRELSAQNRLRALSYGSESVSRSHELDNHRVFAAEGTEMREEWGPIHQVRLESGENVQARLHKAVSYDEGAPINEHPGTPPPPAHLPTRETTGAAIAGKSSDADQRVIETKYDWSLRKPTEMIIDPGGLNLISRTVYDGSSGAPIEQRQPSNPAGGGAGSTQTIYYSATSPHGEHPACESNAQYAGLPCEITPAAQPGTPGQPQLLVRRFNAYNAFGQPTEITESPGGGSEGVRKTLLTYDAAGRQLTKKIEGLGTPIPKVEALYSSISGAPTTQRFVCESECSLFDNQATTTSYDALGRPIGYEDADGNKSSTTYDLLGRPITISDGKGTQKLRYDETSGLLVELEDSAAGTFTASYDADGNMV